MIIDFAKIYKDLICKDVPSVKEDNSIDPGDGEKPYAKDGFVVNYCMEDNNYDKKV